MGVATQIRPSQSSPLEVWLRIFFVGGNISYRALFNWIKPSTYIPTMLGGPLFQSRSSGPRTPSPPRCGLRAGTP